MLKTVLLSLIVLTMSIPAVFAAEDTVVVRTLTFDDITKRSGTWKFPPKQPWRKILMEYTLKCDQRTTQDQYPCGEWDYLTYTFVTDSTGEDDSTLRQRPNYVVRNTTPDSLPYSTSTTMWKRRWREALPVRSGGAEGEWTTLVPGANVTPAIFRTNGGKGRFLWTAAELTGAGLTAGRIVGIRLTALSASSNVNIFTVRLGQQTANGVPNLLGADDLTTVVRRNISVSQGLNNIPFSTPFTWDGVSNIVVELSCHSSASDVLIEAGNGAGVMLESSRYAMNFTQGDHIEIPAKVAADLDKEITIAFWSWGDAAKLPRASSILEAYDAEGRRVLNIHLPWENQNVYWDAGRNAADGNFDRVEKPAPADATEGRWNHWAFVKNARTGVMSVYLNGSLFLTGDGRNRDLKGITRFVLGAGGAGSYEGLIDEFQVYADALDESTIRNWMHRRISESHPRWTQLLVYYRFENDTVNSVARDASAGRNHGQLFGMPTLMALRLEKTGHMTETTTGRPTVQFEYGNIATAANRRDVLLDEEPKITSVVLFERPVQSRVYRLDAPDRPDVATDTLVVQEAGWRPVFDDNDIRVDSIFIQPTATLRKNIGTFFSPIVVWELNRFITPYGIGLDLGPNGFRWVYDVTDYAHLLHDNVTFSSGNQQELIDVTFKFIKGTPPREVKQMKQVYSVRDGSYAAIAAGTLLTPQAITPKNDVMMHSVKTRTTGHRFGEPSQCSEFCQRNHQVYVNGQKRFEWLLWNECGDNPVFPQGGTWTLDRAGWCPGAPVGDYDHDITSFVSAGQPITLDYGVENDQWNASQGVWDVTMHYFGYGSPSRRNDVELVDIIAPSRDGLYHRLNPICGEPIVVIRNVGSERLTSVRFTYGQEGQRVKEVRKTVDLAFLQSDTIVLDMPEFDPDGGEGRFTMTVDNPNDVADEYLDNGVRTIPIQLAPTYYSDLVVQLRTNRQASLQYQWVLRKIGEGVVRSGEQLEDNRIYLDTFNLEDGCYEYVLINREGFGLDHWFVRSQLGTGSLMFQSGGRSIRTFNPDFGNFVMAQFRVAPRPTIATNLDTLRFSTPTPTRVEQTLRVTATTAAQLVIDSVVAFSARNHFSVVSTSRPLPATLTSGDTMDIVVAFERDDAGTTYGTLRIHSNDERNAPAVVRLVGTVGVTSVNTDDADANLPVITVQPNPSIGTADLVVLPTYNRIESNNIQIVITDAIGRTVATIGESSAAIRSISGGGLSVTLPDLPSAVYNVSVIIDGRTVSTPWAVVK